VGAARHQQLAAGAEARAVDRPRVAAKDLADLPAGAGVPEAGGLVRALRRHALRLRGGCGALDPLAVAHGRAHRLSGARLPDVGDALRTAGGDVVAVRAKGPVVQGLVVWEQPHLLAGLHVPESRRLIVAGGEQQPAVGAESEAVANGPVVALE